MDVVEFERLLHIGLGRAILFLQKNDATPYREAILHACLHKVALDKQCEPSRATFMFDIIHLTDEVPFYREQIFAALPNTTDMFDAEQLFNLSRLFAEQGDEDARQLMYDQLATNVAESGDDAGAYAIVKMDGLDGFLFVAEQLAKRSLESDETDFHTMLLEHVEYK
jgi:hypothetical protein